MRHPLPARPLARAALALTLMAATRPVRAQQACGASLREGAQEQELRARTAQAVACEWERTQRDYARIAAWTDDYLEKSASPACELLLVGARAHVALARALIAKGASSEQEARDRENHWRRAWDELHQISEAWDQQAEPASDADTPAALDKCVKPARDLLSKYPSVTITVLPQDATGYSLEWNGITRQGSLPRMVPGRHALRIDPPNGYVTVTTIADAAPLRREGPVTLYVNLQWLDRLRITVQFEDGSAPEECVRNPTACARQPDPRPPPPSRAWLLWSGGAALGAGLLGVAGSALRANSLWDEGARLYYQNQEACSADAVSRSCPGDAKYESGDAWGTWGVGAFGALTLVGAAGLATYFLLPEAVTEQTASVHVQPLIVPALGAWGAAFLQVEGAF